jgi:hypothetical protein
VSNEFLDFIFSQLITKPNFNTQLHSHFHLTFMKRLFSDPVYIYLYLYLITSYHYSLSTSNLIFEVSSHLQTLDIVLNLSLVKFKVCEAALLFL